MKEEITKEEREQAIKLCHRMGIVIAAVCLLLSAMLVFVGVKVIYEADRRSLMMIAAGCGVLAAAFAGILFLRLEKLKTRRQIYLLSAELALSLLGVLALSVIAIVG